MQQIMSYYYEISLKLYIGISIKSTRMISHMRTKVIVIKYSWMPDEVGSIHRQCTTAQQKLLNYPDA
jgi:histidinol phosphatase-like PHP family hydrolase